MDVDDINKVILVYSTNSVYTHNFGHKNKMKSINYVDCIFFVESQSIQQNKLHNELKFNKYRLGTLTLTCTRIQRLTCTRT